MALDQYLAGKTSSAGSSGNLQENLSEALAAAEIGSEETLVRAENPDERHTWKIVSLGQHLGTYQDLCLAPLDVSQYGFQASFSRSGVAIEPSDARLRKQCTQLVSHSLSPGSRRQSLGPAIRARPTERARPAAMMAP